MLLCVVSYVYYIATEFVLRSNLFQHAQHAGDPGHPVVRKKKAPEAPIKQPIYVSSWVYVLVTVVCIRSFLLTSFCLLLSCVQF